MSKVNTPRVKTFLFCEEVRQEKSGKYIILGVFPGGLQARNLPAPVPLSFYIEILSMPLGLMDLSLRISGPGEGVFVLPMVADTRELGRTFALYTPRLEVTLECEGDLVVEIKFGNGDYYEIGRMLIELNSTI